MPRGDPGVKQENQKILLVHHSCVPELSLGHEECLSLKRDRRRHRTIAVCNGLRLN